MRESEKRKQELDTVSEHDSDMKFFSKLKRLNRAIKYEKFEGEELGIMLEHPNVVSIETGKNQSFLIKTINKQKFDYFPKANKTLHRNKNRWHRNGLNWLKNYLNNI